MNSNRQTARRRGAVIKREKIGFLYLALQAGFAPRESLLRHKESLDRPTAASETQRTASQAARCCFCICWQMLFLHLLGTGDGSKNYNKPQMPQMSYIRDVKTLLHSGDGPVLFLPPTSTSLLHMRCKDKGIKVTAISCDPHDGELEWTISQFHPS